MPTLKKFQNQQIKKNEINIYILIDYEKKI